MPFCLTDLCEICGCCMEISCVTRGCHTENGDDEREAALTVAPRAGSEEE